MSDPVKDIAMALMKDGRDKILIPFLIKKAVSKASWLAAPFISPFLSWVISWFVDVFYDEVVLDIFFGINNAEVGIQVSAYNQASEDLLKSLIGYNGDLNAENIKKASDEFNKKLSTLIHLNP